MLPDSWRWKLRRHLNLGNLILAVIALPFVIVIGSGLADAWGWLTMADWGAVAFWRWGLIVLVVLALPIAQLIFLDKLFQTEMTGLGLLVLTFAYLLVNAVSLVQRLFGMSFHHWSFMPFASIGDFVSAVLTAIMGPVLVCIALIAGLIDGASDQKRDSCAAVYEITAARGITQTDLAKGVWKTSRYAYDILTDEMVLYFMNEKLANKSILSTRMRGSLSSTFWIVRTGGIFGCFPSSAKPAKTYKPFPPKNA